MDPTELDILYSLIQKPAFWVVGHVITSANTAAQALGFLPEQDVFSYFLTGHDEFAELSAGSLSLALLIGGIPMDASVIPAGEKYLFIIETETVEPELQVLSLAAMQLRGPLTTLTSSAEAISNLVEAQDAKKQLARLNRSICQILRMVGNMSDISRYRSSKTDYRSQHNISKVFGEIFEKASGLLNLTDKKLVFQNMEQNQYCLLDVEKLERAIFNILSNAAKAAPKNSTIHAALQKRGQLLYLTVENECSPLSTETLRSLFCRYSREPSYLDGNAGIGLGMPLVQQAARIHGGTVLVCQNNGKLTTSLTISLADQRSTTLRTPIFAVDYSSEMDHARIELSDVLPADLYESFFRV